MQKIYAFGDIHGCLEKLKLLVELINPEQDDIFIFLGDYINRGSNSFGVIEYLISFSNKYKNSTFLLGNHEKMFLDYMENNFSGKFIINGGMKVVKEYSASGKFIIPETHINFLKNLKSYHIFDDFAFVHAGFKPGIEFHDNESNDFLWIRDDFIKSDYIWNKKIIFGHTIFIEPYFSPEKIGIDTGAYTVDGLLTCLEVRSEKFWQV